MFILLLVSTLVYQSNDTLRFVQNDSVIETWVLGEEKKGDEIYLNQALTAGDRGRFFTLRERFNPDSGECYTRLVLYDADRRELWSKTLTGERIISFALTRFYDQTLFFAATGVNYDAPQISVLKKGALTPIVKKTEWLGIVDYTVSPNLKFMVMHARKLYYDRPWDYVAFVDLTTKKKWDQPYPVCLSCKRGKLKLTVDNDGRVEVVHKIEHRIFSKTGELLDVYQKID